MGLEYCVKHNGKIYCWDSDDETIMEMTQKSVSITQCPEIVVFELMRHMGRACKEKKDKEI